MSFHLTLDGGGSKVVSVLYDSDLNVIGSGLGGGTNTTQNPIEVVRANIGKCLDEAFAGTGVTEIEDVRFVLVGSSNVLIEELKKRVIVKNICPMSEPGAGILAGNVTTSGILALAGTGSDVFLIDDDFKEHSGGKRTVVGAWGPILGDQGSGTWMGLQALQEFVKSVEGWGEKTMLVDLIREECALQHDFDLVHIVHGDSSPFRKVASFTRLIGKAARAGDEYSRKLLMQAGAVMARQTECLIERFELNGAEQVVSCCGGAWKADTLMFDTFKKVLTEKYPGITVNKPLFEHLMAGPVKLLMEQGLEREEIIKRIREHFPQYVIGW